MIRGTAAKAISAAGHSAFIAATAAEREIEEARALRNEYKRAQRESKRAQLDQEQKEHAVSQPTVGSGGASSAVVVDPRYAVLATAVRHVLERPRKGAIAQDTPPKKRGLLSAVTRRGEPPGGSRGSKAVVAPVVMVPSAGVQHKQPLPPIPSIAMTGAGHRIAPPSPTTPTSARVRHRPPPTLES